MIDIENKYAPKESKEEFVPEVKEDKFKSSKDRHFFRRKERECEKEHQEKGMREEERN